MSTYETASMGSAAQVWAKRQADKQRMRRHELNKRRARALQAHTPPIGPRRTSKLERNYQELDAKARALATKHLTDAGDPLAMAERARDPNWHWKVLERLS